MYDPARAGGDYLLAFERAAPFHEVIALGDREFEIDREKRQQNDGKGDPDYAARAGALVTPCWHRRIMADSGGFGETGNLLRYNNIALQQAFTKIFM